MFGSKTIVIDFDELEVGATGPGTLQFVLRKGRTAIVTRMTADGARAMAQGLAHWADVSDTIAPT